MKKYLSFLERLGLQKEQRDIYISLLESPHMTISEISRSTGYYRPVVYKGIAGLEADGYIESSKISGKRKYYHVTHPDKLRNKLQELNSIGDRIIPEIEALYERSHDAPILRVEEGVTGIRAIHQDMIDTLKQGDVYYCYSSSHEGGIKGEIYLPVGYEKKNLKKEISRSVITNSRESMSEDHNRDIIAIPENFDRFDDDITKLIYADRVAIIDYNSQMGWVIENERFARYEEKIFRLLFRELKKSQKR